MEPGEPAGGERPSGQNRAVLLVGLVLAFGVGFLIMRVLPIWLGLPLLIVLVIAARIYRMRTAGSR